MFGGGGIFRDPGGGRRPLIDRDEEPEERMPPVIREARPGEGRGGPALVYEIPFEPEPEPEEQHRVRPWSGLPEPQHVNPNKFFDDPPDFGAALQGGRNFIEGLKGFDIRNFWSTPEEREKAGPTRSPRGLIEPDDDGRIGSRPDGSPIFPEDVGKPNTSGGQPWAPRSQAPGVGRAEKSPPKQASPPQKEAIKGPPRSMDEARERVREQDPGTLRGAVEGPGELVEPEAPDSPKISDQEAAILAEQNAASGMRPSESQGGFGWTFGMGWPGPINDPWRRPPSPDAPVRPPMTDRDPPQPEPEPPPKKQRGETKPIQPPEFSEPEHNPFSIFGRDEHGNPMWPIQTHNHRHQTPEQRRRSEAELIEARPNPDQSTWKHPIRDTEFSRSVPTELDPTLKRRQGGEGGWVGSKMETEQAEPKRVNIVETMIETEPQRPQPEPEGKRRRRRRRRR